MGMTILRHPTAQVLLAAWVAALAGLAAWYLMWSHGNQVGMLQGIVRRVFLSFFFSFLTKTEGGQEEEGLAAVFRWNPPPHTHPFTDGFFSPQFISYSSLPPLLSQRSVLWTCIIKCAILPDHSSVTSLCRHGRRFIVLLPQITVKSIVYGSKKKKSNLWWIRDCCLPRRGR